MYQSLLSANSVTISIIIISIIIILFVPIVGFVCPLFCRVSKKKKTKSFLRKDERGTIFVCAFLGPEECLQAGDVWKRN